MCFYIERDKVNITWSVKYCKTGEHHKYLLDTMNTLIIYMQNQVICT